MPTEFERLRSRRQICEVVARLKVLKASGGDAADKASPQPLLEELQDVLRVGPRHPDRKFKAGGANEQAAAWKAWLDAVGHSIPGKKAAQVLDMISNGVSFAPCNPSASCQKRHPHYEQKRAKVLRMLRAHYSQQDVQVYMSRNQPTPLDMPHHRSAIENEHKISESIDDMLQRGSCVTSTAWALRRTRRTTMAIDA